MPARTLNDFFAGFLMAEPKKILAIKSLNGKERQGREMSVIEANPRTGDRRTRGGRMEDNRRRNRY
jgi:hypothetical protein